MWRITSRREAKATLTNPDFPGYTVERWTASGELVEVCWRYRGHIHRDGDKPAIERMIRGKPSSIEWYQKDLLHRDVGPALIAYGMISDRWQESTMEWWQQGTIQLRVSSGHLRPPELRRNWWTEDSRKAMKRMTYEEVRAYLSKYFRGEAF